MSQTGRAAEMAVAAAISHLILTIFKTWHLVLFLVPILVLLRIGLARRDQWVLGVAILAYLLIGPAYSGMQRTLAEIFAGSMFNVTSDLLLRVWNECQLLGMIVLWLGCLRALRIETPSDLIAAGRQVK